MIIFDLYPNGKTKAVTFSYDDGSKNDLRLVDTFDKYGVKATFNLVSAWIDASDNFLNKADVLEISKTHEIANHTKHHLWNERIPIDQMVSEVVECKNDLEDIIGKSVRGYAYPNGKYNDELLALLKGLGVSYARTAAQLRTFAHPENFLLWSGTCHHDNAVGDAKNFIKLTSYGKLPVFYVWGHSHDFERKGNWNALTETLEILKEDNTIWYATNIELYEYLTAIKQLKISHGEKSVYNPSCISVYATVDGKAVEFKPGLTLL
ncbi:MAG: polysaccharide deacetylase family protein [Clostridia bacterium]|nr:polysaccharide deacetylase family protein [Clostridia bacterium]MBQ4098268.1 polysaccharide deacetylase family protein [Clostridia bacterium]